MADNNTSNANVIEEDLFPALTKDDVERELGKYNTPDYNLLINEGVAESIQEYPGVGKVEANVFNRYYKVFPSDEMTGLIKYVFIVRPDCNMDYCIRNDTYFRDIAMRFPRVIASLTQSYGGVLRGLFNDIGYEPSHHFISWLVPRTLSYSIPDFELKVYDYEQPYTNFHTGYAGNGNDSRSGAVVDLTFRETKNLEVTLLFDAWLKYIDGIQIGQYSPKQKYVTSRITDGSVILDYTTSIYEIACLPDATTIVYVHKTTALFPTGVPHSIWSHDGGGYGSSNNVNIRMSGGLPEAYDPSIMADFNYNAGCSQITTIASDRNYTTPIVGAPFITYSAPNRKYYLRWRSAQ